MTRLYLGFLESSSVQLCHRIATWNQSHNVLGKFWGPYPPTVPNCLCFHTSIRINMVYLCVAYINTGYFSETSTLRAGMAFDANPVNPSMF